MHYRLLVLINKENAKTSKEARMYVFDRLSEEGFAGEPTRFRYPVADSFVIGGRWSGELTKTKLNEEKLKEFEKKLEDVKDKEQAEKLFKECFPELKETTPCWREEYKIDGYEDDAEIVTEELWDKLISKCDLNADNGDYYSGNMCIDIDNYDDITKENTVGKKWVVVVDFHN